MREVTHDREHQDRDTSDWNYILSTVGNALFSGLTFEELWCCVEMSDNREQLDAAVTEAIRLKEILR